MEKVEARHTNPSVALSAAASEIPGFKGETWGTRQ
jgi:hypothetical protein